MKKLKNYGGGIVIADGADFINNSVDIYFAAYNKHNKSLIRKSNFSTTTLLLDEIEVPSAHIFLGGIKSINVRGCLFENTTAIDVYSMENRGKGINAFNSSFTADDNPDGFGFSGTGSHPNSFSDLTYGIYAIASEVGSNNIVVNKNNFDENFRGYYLSGSVLSETNLNTFTMMAENGSYGLYLHGSTAYDVQENIFTKNVADLNNTIGIIANNSGTGDNLIYRNIFSNLNAGSIAMDENGGESSGLVFKCGDYETGWIDIGVVSDEGTGSVNPDQGECLPAILGGYLTAPANNLFSDPSEMLTHHQLFASTDVDDILYVFFEDVDATTRARPTEFSDPFDPFPSGVDNTGCPSEVFDPEDWATEYCPSNFGSGGGGGGGRMANPGFSKYLLRLTNPENQITGKEAEDSIDENTWQENIMLHAQLRYYMANEMNDSILYILDENESPLAMALLGAIAIESADYESAENYMIGLSSEHAIEEGYSNVLQNISIELAIDTLTWMDIDSAQQAEISAIASVQDRIGIQANHITHYLKNQVYIEPIPYINEEMIEIKKNLELLLPEKNSINIYPNPVQSLSIIQINIEDNSDTGLSFIISDITGKKLMKCSLHQGSNYIEISNKILEKGVYIGYISGLSENIARQFIVIK